MRGTGIERRAAHVYGQPWLPPMQLLRGLWPGLATRTAARYHADMEDKWLASGATAVPVGAGGEADSAASASAKAGA